MLMKPFVFMPRMRTIGRVHTALWQARQQFRHPTTYVEYQHCQPYEDGYDNVTFLYEKARQHFLSTDCDTFISVEDDIIIPPNGFNLLADTVADVAMGIYCLRQKPNYRWNAFVSVKEDEGMSITEHDVHEVTTLCRNRDVKQVAGVGLGFTMIKRHVLETIKFERRGNACNDWYFSVDCQTNGFTQVANFDVLCGHFVTQASRFILWPDYLADNLHRKEQL